MKFILGVNTIEFSIPATYPYGRSTELVQVKDKTASGVVHVEDFSVVTNELKVSFKDLPEADYLALLDWHVNIAQGMLYPFDMTDDLGDTYHVRFLSSEISGNLTAFELWDVSFIVEEVV